MAMTSGRQIVCPTGTPRINIRQIVLDLAREGVYQPRVVVPAARRAVALCEGGSSAELSVPCLGKSAEDFASEIFKDCGDVRIG
jgi:hypothetical protein